MKNFAFTAILFLGFQAIYAVTQTRPSYLDREAQIVLVGHADKGQTLPLVVFLPYTTSDARHFFQAVSSCQPWDAYVALIPYGVTQREHYLPDFWSYIQWYEKRILVDIKTAQALYPIDTNRIYMEGFSLGGDLGWAFMIRHKELFAGALVNGSRCSYPVTDKDLRYLLEHHRKIILTIGDHDMQDRRNGMSVAAGKLKKAGVKHVYYPFPGDHTIPSEVQYRELLLWLTNTD